MAKRRLIESRGEEIKQVLIGYLADHGYGTFARRLKAYRIIIADMYERHYIEVAAMIPNTDMIIINPNMVNISKMFVAGDNRRDEDKLMEQLSVVIRHEMLHFMLTHEKRLLDHLKAIDPKWELLYRLPITHKVANFAMDYEISYVGYSEKDKEIVRLLTLSNKVIGGLIADDDHPEWKNKTMEEMFDILFKEHEEEIEKQKNPPTINIKRVTHSQEYVDMYNKIISELDDDNISDAELDTLLDSAEKGDAIYNPKTNEILLDINE